MRRYRSWTASFSSRSVAQPGDRSGVRPISVRHQRRKLVGPLRTCRRTGMDAPVLGALSGTHFGHHRIGAHTWLQPIVAWRQGGRPGADRDSKGRLYEKFGESLAARCGSRTGRRRDHRHASRAADASTPVSQACGIPPGAFGSLAIRRDDRGHCPRGENDTDSQQRFRFRIHPERHRALT